MLEIGSRVEIHDDSLGIHDFGEIKHIISGEMLPFQILCDKGDEDGHRTLRFAKEHIALVTEEKPVEVPKHPLPVVEVVQPRQTFLKGQQYYAKLRESGTHYSLYTVEMKSRGTMPVGMFKNTPFDVPITFRTSDIITSNTKPLQKPKRVHKHREVAKTRITHIVTKIIKEKEVKKAKTHYEKMELLGQMNLFEMEDLG